MPTPFHDAIRRYYTCFRQRDREGLQRLLTPDFHHAGPFGEYRDRDGMLEAIWPRVGGSWAEELDIFGEPPDFVVTFTTVSAEGRAVRMAERVHFRGERIAAVETFIGREGGDRGADIGAGPAP